MNIADLIAAKFAQLRTDAELLRQYGRKETDKGEVITNPRYFAEGTKWLAWVAANESKYLDAARDLQRSFELWEAIIKEIEAESPACAGRITEHLRELEERVTRPLTPSGEAKQS